MIKLIKFCIVGVANTTITLLSFYLFNKILLINYLLSTVVSYSIGMLNSYILNKEWTFCDKDKRIVLQLIEFTMVNGVSLSLNLIIMHLLVSKLYVDTFLSQVFATGFSIISNYIGSKFIVFHSINESSN
ncbi:MULTISPECIES: GtrA family protein [Clostridium]|uniref:GtrA-like protein n=3 Tax=Clostridium TaxID=1485 RepID=D8GUN6_CLOLD|nr:MULTISPECIES: GtrA family protein [Clostridium]ADK16913.1 GtrA-like protein [Clostridium ljungdahlii DSM 13528]AGY75955.1 GtrA family protein [Clostridium autoethanogenum DSM 10061]ALU36119.1 GtrA family protein [Clostridium autoethanogenum DSM 10061]OAA85289.1 GtrA-like protein [Clostridium ljungdahlii DSM 13528]OVY51823.1 GtrA-like protein [Clostridium autoethanogenum]